MAAEWLSISHPYHINVSVSRLTYSSAQTVIGGGMSAMPIGMMIMKG